MSKLSRRERKAQQEVVNMAVRVVQEEVKKRDLRLLAEYKSTSFHAARADRLSKKCHDLELAYYKQRDELNELREFKQRVMSAIGDTSKARKAVLELRKELLA